MRHVVRLAILSTALLVGGSGVAAPGPGTLLVLREVGYRTQQIYTVDADGTGLTNLTPTYRDMAVIDSPAWSPDGTEVAFSAALYHPMFGRNLYILDTVSGDRRTLRSGYGYSSHATWSPDGSRLAFVEGPEIDTTAVIVIDADGSDPHTIVEARAPDGVGSVDWSSTGELAYVLSRYYGSVREIHAVHPDGTGDRIVTSGLSPTWSPDGSRLSFLNASSPFHLFVVNADGTERRQLSAREAISADWSPDGKEIVFTANYSQYDDRNDVYAVEVDGARERLVKTSACCASWSTDGRQFALWDQVRGHAVINADGTCQRLVPGWFGAKPWRPGTGGAPVRCADLKLQAVSSASLLRTRDHLRYRLEVSNTGESTATGTRLVANLSGRVARVTLAQTQGSCTTSGTTVVCELGDLEVGRSAVVDVRVYPHAAGALGASVTAGANEIDTQPGDTIADLAARAYSCSILGTLQGDALRGTRRSDLVCSLDGDDSVSAADGADVVLAGEGDDRISGGPGQDAIGGEDGSDTINPGPGRDKVWGGSGDDRIGGGSGQDTLRGDDDSDTINPGSGRDKVWGGPGDDRIVVLDGAKDLVDCGPDFDVVLADPVDRVALNCESVRRIRR